MWCEITTSPYHWTIRIEILMLHQHEARNTAGRMEVHTVGSFWTLSTYFEVTWHAPQSGNGRCNLSHGLAELAVKYVCASDFFFFWFAEPPHKAGYNLPRIIPMDNLMSDVQAAMKAKPFPLASMSEEMQRLFNDPYICFYQCNDLLMTSGLWCSEGGGPISHIVSKTIGRFLPQDVSPSSAQGLSYNHCCMLLSFFFSFLQIWGSMSEMHVVHCQLLFVAHKCHCGSFLTLEIYRKFFQTISHWICKRIPFISLFFIHRMVSVMQPVSVNSSKYCSLHMLLVYWSGFLMFHNSYYYIYDVHVFPLFCFFRESVCVS